MNEAFVTRELVSLSSAGAREIVASAERHALGIAVPECIAVVDGAGELLAFSRMDGARPASIEISIAKARSAARRRRATATESGGDAQRSIPLVMASGGSVTALGGGLPILVDGRVAGAIGVSSGTVDEDIAIAEAGIAALGA